MLFDLVRREGLANVVVRARIQALYAVFHARALGQHQHGHARLFRAQVAQDADSVQLRQGLEGEHYAVDVLPDGEQARTAATQLEYDVVMLDLNLPKLDGVSVLRHLRTKKPSVPVLVLTQRTRVEDRVQCLDTGADDYIRKPFTPDQVKEHVLPVLEKKS